MKIKKLYLALDEKVKNEFHEWFWTKKPRYSGAIINEMVLKLGMKTFDKWEKTDQESKEKVNNI